MKLKYWSHHTNKEQKSLRDFKELRSFCQFGEMQGEHKKMVDINEIAPVKPLFEGATKIKKEDLVDKESKQSPKLIVDAYAEMEGDDGKFGVIRFLMNGKTYSTTLSAMLLDRIIEAGKKIGLDAEKSTQKEFVLKQTIEVVLVEKQSEKNSNRQYYDFKAE